MELHFVGEEVRRCIDLVEEYCTVLGEEHCIAVAGTRRIAEEEVDHIEVVVRSLYAQSQ